MDSSNSHSAAQAVARPRGARALDAALVVAILAAIGLAVSGVTEDPGALPADAAVLVNGQPIARAELDAVLARVTAQLGHEPTPAERAEVLARLVDEELLIQRGLALGLPRSEGRLRSLLVQEAMRHALAGVAGQPVGDAELAGFYAANSAFFRKPARLHVRRYDLADAGAAEALREALRARGPAALGPWESARNLLLPDAPLPAARLQDQLGAEASALLAGSAPGESVVQQRPDGSVSVLVLLAADGATTPSLDALHAEVEAEFRRRRDEQALQDYLRRLREDSRIVTGDGDS